MNGCTFVPPLLPVPVLHVDLSTTALLHRNHSANVAGNKGTIDGAAVCSIVGRQHHSGTNSDGSGNNHLECKWTYTRYSREGKTRRLQCMYMHTTTYKRPLGHLHAYSCPCITSATDAVEACLVLAALYKANPYRVFTGTVERIQSTTAPVIRVDDIGTVRTQRALPLSDDRTITARNCGIHPFACVAASRLLHGVQTTTRQSST